MAAALNRTNAAQLPVVAPPKSGPSPPPVGTAAGDQPDALIGESVIHVRIPELASLDGTPLDPSSPIDLGTANDPMFAILPVGNPDCGCGGGPDGMATVEPNQGNLQLSQPLDYRWSAPGGVNGDNFARLASPALVYNSNTVNVQPVGEIYPQFDLLPTNIKLAVEFDGSAYGSDTTFSTSGHSASDTYLLAGQYTTNVTSSGLYSWAFRVNASPNPVVYFLGNYPAIANANSPFGAGWSLSGLDRLYFNADGSIMWAFGANATPAVFAADPDTGALIYPANFYGTWLHNVDLSWTYTTEHQVKYNFSSGGLLLSITDPHNQAVTYTYSTGLPSTIQMPDGGVTTYSYNGSNQVTQVTEPGGRAVTMAYDGNNNLIGVTDADGSRRTYSYDGNHKLTGMNWSLMPF